MKNEQQLALANEYLERIGKMNMPPFNQLLVGFLNYAGGQLTFVKTACTEQTGGGVMNDQLHLSNGKLLVISEDLICLYENEEQYNTGNLPASQTICLYDIPKKEAKKDMHLLFGREVCETMAEEGIDEVCNLINDGAEYSIMKTDGSNLTAVLSELEDKGGYCFLTLDEYNKILEV